MDLPEAVFYSDVVERAVRVWVLSILALFTAAFVVALTLSYFKREK